MVNRNGTLTISSAFFGILTGLLIPIFFVILDLKQMGLPPSWPNILDIFDLQYIYFFAALLFPVMFGALFFLLARLAMNNEQLDNQTQYMTDLVDSLDSFVAVTDIDGNIQMSNQAYKNLIKVIPHSGDTDNILAILDNDTLFRKIIQDHVLPPTEITIDIGGTFSYFVLSVSEFRKTGDTEETQSLYIFSLKDIHQLKEKEKIIKEQEANMQNSARLSSLGEMAAGIAHEINNPLSIISANNHLMRKVITRNNGEIEIDRLLELTENSDNVILRITKIINSLRNISRNGEKDPFENIPLKDAIDEAVELCRMKIHGTNVKFEIQENILLSSLIKVQKIQFSQVLINLLNNAVDAAMEHSSQWIKLSFDDDENWLYVRITDCGSGIPHELETKIFEPLFTTKRIGKGTGLGLSLSRSIILVHDGDLFVNQNCQNTQIVIKLPRNLALAA